LYHAAVAHDRGQRAAFLARACGDDHALRREVESWLAQPVSSFPGAPAVEVAAQLLSVPGASVSAGR
jgi:hypothetical protein